MSAPYANHDSWRSPLSVADLHRLLVAKVEARKGEVLRAPAAEIQAEFGSLLKYKLKGARLTKPHEFPLRATIRLSPAGDATAVDVTVEDGFGAGWRMGLAKSQTERAMQDLVRFLRTDLVAA